MTPPPQPPGSPGPPSPRVGPYRLGRLLGQGGMGSVHEAIDATGRVVALKLIDLGADPGSAARQTFDREVAASRSLRHPGIVAVLDAGQAEGFAFLVTELVPGGDLGGLRARLPQVPWQWAAEAAQQAARALAHAHERGVVHRDVKPANLLLDLAARQVKLADFGLARLADLHRSRTGVLAGTPAYMSPEHLADGVQDARSDIYSLGVVLFELIAGRTPHQAGSLGALLRDIGRKPAPELATLDPRVPADLSRLVARTLRRDPQRRPASAQELADELQAIAPVLAALGEQGPPMPCPWDLA